MHIWILICYFTYRFENFIKSVVMFFLMFQFFVCLQFYGSTTYLRYTLSTQKPPHILRHLQNFIISTVCSIIIRSYHPSNKFSTHDKTIFECSEIWNLFLKTSCSKNIKTADIFVRAQKQMSISIISYHCKHVLYVDNAWTLIWNGCLRHRLIYCSTFLALP